MERQGHLPGAYGRFLPMIATAMTVIFLLSHTNSFQVLDHGWFSESRLYLSFLISAATAVIILLFLLRTGPDGRKNRATFMGALLLFLVGLWPECSQVFVTDVDDMEGRDDPSSIHRHSCQRPGAN